MLAESGYGKFPVFGLWYFQESSFQFLYGFLESSAL